MYTYNSSPASPRVPLGETMVPEPFGPPTSKMAKRYVSEVMEHLSSGEEIYGVPDVEEIENRHQSGFIPFTDGGWQACGCNTLDYAYGSGSYPKALERIIETSLCDALEDFMKQRDEVTFPENSRDGLPVACGWDRFNFLWDWMIQHHGEGEEAGGWREDYYEWETTWLCEGGTYFWKSLAIFYDVTNSENEMDGDAILFEVYLNTDLDYGRDYIPWLSHYGYRKWVLVKDLDDALVDQMVKETEAAIHAMF